MKKLILFYLIAVLSFSAQAELKCEGLFDQISLGETQSFPQFILNEELGSIQNRNDLYVKQELARLTPNELSQLRAETSAIQAASQLGRSVIRNLSVFSGSRRVRLETEEKNVIRPIENQLKTGQVTSVIRTIQYTFAHYEVNFLYAKELENRIQELRNMHDKFNPASKQREKVSAEILSLKFRLGRAQAYLGFNFYKFLAMREMLDGMINSNSGKNSIYAQQAQEQMQNLSMTLAGQRRLKYEPVKLSEVTNYVRISDASQKFLKSRIAFEEVWVIIKLFTMSDLVIKVSKKMNILSSALASGVKNQQLREAYMTSIEELLDTTGDISDQYKALIRLNSYSKKDEFMTTFIRVPENREVWLSLKEHAAKQVDANAFDKDFYKRMEAAEVKAIAKGEYPLYYEEPGATKMMKILGGMFSGYTAGTAYAANFPQHFDYVFANIDSFLKVFGGGLY